MFLSSDPLHYKTSASSFIKFEDIPSKPRAFDVNFFPVLHCVVQDFGNFSPYSCNTASTIFNLLGETGNFLGVNIKLIFIALY